METVIDKVELNSYKFDTRIEATTKPGWFLRLIGFKKKTDIYLGSCTVWYQLDRGDGGIPSWVRCSTPTESWLCDIEKNHKINLKK